MNANLTQYCDELIAEFALISAERKQLLERITAYIQSKKDQHKLVNLIYICTHNSRRSHFGQIWAHVAADYFRVPQVHTFSGGTEATAFHPHAIHALERIGFRVTALDDGCNAVYQVSHDDQSEPSMCFSKVYDNPANPASDFAAIMTCGDAEENCPFIPGVELRIGTTYDDPKAFDLTPQQDEKYDERCRQIGRETFYVFSRVN